MARGSPQRPLVAIVGATGTGKSQLAVKLATRFNGEIINGDAMQMYNGLPIITNKIPIEERNGIPHHLLGCIGLGEPTWTVGRFVDRACRVIDEIHDRGRLPILVGGTHYYTQSLLFRDHLADQESTPHDEDASCSETGRPWPILQESTEAILERLREVDPIMADRWHPKDRRKIQRSLEIWLNTGKKASEIYGEQRLRKQANHTVSEQDDSFEQEMQPPEGSMLRYPTLLLWVHASPDVLRARLETRVDKMIDNGLLSELKSLDDFLCAQREAGNETDKTRGIWVSIGYKEFEAYQSALKAGTISERDLSRLREEAIEQTKAATRQYAKRQVRWIRIKLLNAIQDAGATGHMFLLDGTNLNSSQDMFQNLSVSLTSNFLEGGVLPDPKSLSPAAQEFLTPKRKDLSQHRDAWQRQLCDMCNMVAVTESDWANHIKGRGHRRAVLASKKQALKPAHNIERMSPTPKHAGEAGEPMQRSDVLTASVR